MYLYAIRSSFSTYFHSHHVTTGVPLLVNVNSIWVDADHLYRVVLLVPRNIRDIEHPYRAVLHHVKHF